MLLFWGLIILAIVALVRWLSNTSLRNDGHTRKKAIGILEERFARGEINKDKKRVLGH
ncbi:MAG: hypothetical protein OEU36_20515 [Gammaproteobacteria bacterium]|nr:hypothetical protein [Gammaproteobacteria bacterium]